jgi:tetratricopeptide (TPR) repeat protein
MNLAGALIERAETHDEACLLLRRALDAFRASKDPTHADVMGTTADLGTCLTAQGRGGEARALVDAALALGPRRSDRGTLLRARADTMMYAGDLPAAERDLRAGLVEYRAVYPETHFEILETRGLLAEVLADRGRPDQALRELDDALAACRRDRAVAGVAALHRRRGTLLLGRRRFAEAQAAFRESLRMMKEEQLPEPEQDHALHGLGEASLGLGRLDEGIALLERALALRPAGRLPPQRRAWTARALAGALVRKGGHSERACDLGREAVTQLGLAGPRYRPSLRQAQAWVAARCPRSLISARRSRSR